MISMNNQHLILLAIILVSYDCKGQKELNRNDNIKLDTIITYKEWLKDSIRGELPIVNIERKLSTFTVGVDTKNKLFYYLGDNKKYHPPLV